MTTTNTPPDKPSQARFFQWVQGWATLKLCHNLVKSGVFEQIAEQSRALDDMTAAYQLRPDVLYRALRMTTALEFTAQSEKGYTLTKSRPGSR